MILANCSQRPGCGLPGAVSRSRTVHDAHEQSRSAPGLPPMVRCA